MSTAHHDEKFAKMAFSKVYPLYLNKVQRKGRSEQELLTVIVWLTGYSETQLRLYASTQSVVTFRDFFSQPECMLNPDASLITGTICGHRVETIVNPLTQKVRYLDKLVDELAMGRSLDKICRSKSSSASSFGKSSETSGKGHTTTPSSDAAAPSVFADDKKIYVSRKAKAAVAMKSIKAKPKVKGQRRRPKTLVRVRGER